ncbi:MAG: hypothetical protein FWH27_07485 [Planctomycetaceae bacterium]|nr:hypothetical protein [Planctomycetaceae bacterium]
MKNVPLPYLHSELCSLHFAPFRPLDNSRGSDWKYSALCILLRFDRSMTLAALIGNILHEPYSFST